MVLFQIRVVQLQNETFAIHDLRFRGKYYPRIYLGIQRKTTWNLNQVNQVKYRIIFLIRDRIINAT